MGLVYKAFLQPPVDTDVVKRELDLNVNGASQIISLEGSAVEAVLPAVPDNAVVQLRIRDTDDAGNISEWSDTREFVAVDTIIPTKPGEINVKLVAEVADVPVVDETVSNNESTNDTTVVEDTSAEDTTVDENVNDQSNTETT